MGEFSFVKSETEMKYFKSGENASWMYDSEGLFVTWATNPEAIKKVLPPQLTMVAPVVTAYIIDAKKPNFSKGYKESALIIPALYNGKPGLYTMSMLLQGSDNAVFTGREELGIPKKNADKITLSRDRNTAKACVIRDGNVILDVECEIGKYNNPMAGQVFGDREGKDVDGNQFFYKFDIDQDKDANIKFSNLQLLEVHTFMKYRGWEPAEVKITLGSTSHDPWGELPVLQPLGAAWTSVDIGLLGATPHEIKEVDETMPYILNRYDSYVFGK